jgi:putative transposase
MTVVGKVLVTDNSTAILLGLLGFSATKLWNTALWLSKLAWRSTGKIPSYVAMDASIKRERPLWYRRLHSQSAQAILEELWQSYKSWFALRKKGDLDTNPPGFRRKTDLSSVTFKQNAVKWNPRTKTARLSIPKDIYGKQFLYLKIRMPEGIRISDETIQVARLIHKKGVWYVHFVYNEPLPALKGSGETMAIDLGMKHLAATACTDGKTGLWPGGELSSLERYFDKQKSKTTKSTSRKSRALNQKRSRQRTHLIHSLTKSLVRDADARGVSTLIVGDLKDIRDGKNWGDSGNQKLHKWPFDRIINMIEYKARMCGIRVVKEPEDYTSQTCCECGIRQKSNRVHRGLYSCSKCGSTINADVNGARNILARYLPEHKGASWGSGCLAQPAVNRFAWRNTRPASKAHKPGTWHTSMPHPRTESVVALSALRV